MMALRAAFALCLFCGSVPGSHERLQELGRNVYRAYWQLYPVEATRCGFHEFGP